MKRIISLMLMYLLCCTAVFAANLKDTVPQAKTKLEQFSARTGVVLIHGFEEIGTVHGLYNTSVKVESKEFKNVTDGKKEFGITIEVKKEDGRYDKEHTSYIDYDEIDSLIKGIEYIAKVDGSVTKLTNFQADYKTKGDLKISTFSSNGQVRAAVSSGTIGSVGAYFKIESLSEIKKLLSQAKAKIDSLKLKK